MSMRELVSVFPESPVWSQLTWMRTQAHFQQATLITIPAALDFPAFLDRVLTHLFCVETLAPCGSCAMCAKILNDHHPDIHYIHPETPTGSIKIEQIRELQTKVYQTPQLGERQMVVIYPAEAMNQAAASALLKILEEPPASTLFLLVTTNATLLLPTILSRCQSIQMQSEAPSHDILALGKNYALNAPRGVLYAQRFDLFAQLEEVLAKRLSPCTAAEQWATHALQDGLWFFGTILSKLIQLRLLTYRPLESEYQPYSFFKHTWCPENLYHQLDGLSAMLQQIQQQINLNATLVWERILLNFLEGYIQC